MPFTPGRKKTGGRKAGTPNRTTTTLRERMKDIVEGLADQIEQDLRELEPRERIAAWTRLAEYVVPKLNRTEVVDSTPPGDLKEWVIVLPAPSPDESASDT